VWQLLLVRFSSSFPCTGFGSTLAARPASNNKQQLLNASHTKPRIETKMK
jgi:hypothetical protein